MQVEVGQQWRQHRSLRRARRGVPVCRLRHDLLVQERLNQRQHAAVADRTFHQAQQPLMRDGVEVALQVGVHHMGEAFLQQPIDLPQRVLAAPPGSEAVASGAELNLENGFDCHLQGGLHDAVLHHGDPKRTGLAVALGDLHPLDRVRPVAAVRQAGPEFGETALRVMAELLDALTIHARRPFVARDTMPRQVQGMRTSDFIDQAEPLASFDAVAQRRHHAIRPDRAFRPPQIMGSHHDVVAGLVPASTHPSRPSAPRRRETQRIAPLNPPPAHARPETGCETSRADHARPPAPGTPAAAGKPRQSARPGHASACPNAAAPQAAAAFPRSPR